MEITFEKQTKLYDAEKSIRGNCMVACYANYLNFKIDDCPKFEELFDCVQPNGFWFDVVLLWWNKLGYEYHTSNFKSDIPNECELYFVVGISPRNANINHLVIYKNGELYFDPHPDNSGIVKNTECGYEWVTKI